jgi:hypothetical protein
MMEGRRMEDKRKAYSKHGHAQSLGVFADECMLNLDVFCEISRSANGARHHFEKIGVVDDKQLDTSVKRSPRHTPSQVKRLAQLAVAHNCRQRRGQILKAYASYVSRNLSRMRSTSSTVLTARMFSCHQIPTAHFSSLITGSMFSFTSLTSMGFSYRNCNSMWHYLGKEVPGRCASSSQSRPLPGNACIKQAVKELKKQVWKQQSRFGNSKAGLETAQSESIALLEQQQRKTS